LSQAKGDARTACGSLTDFDKVSGFDFAERLRTEREKPADLGESIRVSSNHYNRDFALSEILLIAEIGIQGDEYVESAFGQLQEVAVLFTGPTHFLHSSTVMTGLFEEALEGARRTFVNQHPHRS
jgi:hypothetical protein